MAYEHDAFGHITSKTGYYYRSQDDNSYSYTNNRAPNWSYDSDGNTTSDADAVYGFDAAGHLVKTEERELDTSGLQPPTIDSFDGAGQLVKRVRNFGSTTPAPQTNYFIHSSVLGKVVSEADETGRKLKTFVPANGVTLAQQQVIYYQGTTERLTFVHQDASTTGTQETTDDGTLVNPSTRSGEYDPLGRNIASAGAYITLDTNPPGSDSGSGINMFGSGQGYRPGQQSYRIDHLAVPASLFMEEINSGLIGGAFGLLEMTARMSSPRFAGYTLRYGNGDIAWAGWDLEGAIGRMEGGETLIRNWFVSDQCWTVNLSIVSFQTQQHTQQQQGGDATLRLPPSAARGLKSSITKAADNTKLCRKYIADLINKAAEIAGASVVKIMSTNVEDLFDLARSSKGDPPGSGGVKIRFTGGFHTAENGWDYRNGPPYSGIIIKIPTSVVTGGPKYYLDRRTADYLGDPSTAGISALHELVHTAIWSRWPARADDDFGLAGAAAALAGEEAPNFTSVGEASRYWGDHLRNACGFMVDGSRIVPTYKLYK